MILYHNFNFNLNINLNNKYNSENKIKSCNISCSIANDNEELCKQNNDKCVWVSNNDINLCKLKK